MDTFTLQKRLSENIKRLRKGKFTQETLSEEAEISLSTLNGIECCSRWVSEDTLVKLANALKCDVHEFFIPAESENSDTKDIYSTIRQQILSEIKTSIIETINNLEK